MIQYFMKQYLFLLWGITSLIFSSLFLACSDDEPGDKTPVFTIKEEYLQQSHQIRTGVSQQKTCRVLRPR